MQILRYTDKLQKQLTAKTKPEPWLHCAIQPAADNKGGMYVIYVWDTRQVVEEGKLSRAQLFEKWNNRYSTSHYVLRGRPARTMGSHLKAQRMIGNSTKLMHRSY